MSQSVSALWVDGGRAGALTALVVSNLIYGQPGSSSVVQGVMLPGYLLHIDLLISQIRKPRSLHAIRH